MEAVVEAVGVEAEVVPLVMAEMQLEEKWL